MASNHDYFLAGDHESGKALVADALTQLGFEVATTPNGGFTAKRGSFAKTMWLGAMAGKNFHVTFIVEFFTDAQGALVARLSRSLGSSGVKGGALGVAKTAPLERLSLRAPRRSPRVRWGPAPVGPRTGATRCGTTWWRRPARR